MNSAYSTEVLCGSAEYRHPIRLHVLNDLDSPTRLVQTSLPALPPDHRSSKSVPSVLTPSIPLPLRRPPAAVREHSTEAVSLISLADWCFEEESKPRFE